MQLVSQFRCNGSDGYLAWLDQALEIRETANYDLDGIDYDIRICDTPAEMETIVLERIVPEIEQEFLQAIVGTGRRLPEIIQISMISRLEIIP